MGADSWPVPRPQRYPPPHPFSRPAAARLSLRRSRKTSAAPAVLQRRAGTTVSWRACLAEAPWAPGPKASAWAGAGHGLRQQSPQARLGLRPAPREHPSTRAERRAPAMGRPLMRTLLGGAFSLTRDERCSVRCGGPRGYPSRTCLSPLPEGILASPAVQAVTCVMHRYVLLAVS